MYVREPNELQRYLPSPGFLVLGAAGGMGAAVRVMVSSRKAGDPGGGSPDTGTGAPGVTGGAL